MWPLQQQDCEAHGRPPRVQEWQPQVLEPPEEVLGLDQHPLGSPLSPGSAVGWHAGYDLLVGLIYAEDMGEIIMTF